MKNFSTAGYLNKVWVLALVAMFAACSQFEAPGPDELALENGDEMSLVELWNSGMLSARTAGPIKLEGKSGGNVFCSDAAEYFNVEGGFEFTSPDPEGTGGNKHLGDGMFEEAFADGFTITVTDNKFVSWSFEPIYIDGVKYCLKDLVVLVKGGPGANAYFYNEGQTSDSGLESPLNQGGNIPDLSNLKLCYNLEPCDEPCEEEWKGETAWAADCDDPGSLRYTNRGNWATYTKYDGKRKRVTLFGGQTLPAGTVRYSAPEDGYVTITIELNEGWRFKADPENVKIQDYKYAPSGNPSPGQFDHKGEASGDKFRIKVPENNFYGVHVDVERLIGEKCPDDEEESKY